MRPYGNSGVGREALSEVQVGSGVSSVGEGGPPEGPGGVGRPFCKSVMGREALPQVRKAHLEVHDAIPKVWDGLRGPIRGPKGVGRGPPNPSRTTGKG